MGLNTRFYNSSSSYSSFTSCPQSLLFLCQCTALLSWKKNTDSTSLLFVADLLKGWAVAIVLGSPFLAAFLYIFKWAGVQFVPWLMAFMISFQLIMVVIHPTVIQPLFNKLSPLPESDLRSRIESLATKLKFPLSTCGSKRSSHSNAYFHGVSTSSSLIPSFSNRSPRKSKQYLVIKLLTPLTSPRTRSLVLPPPHQNDGHSQIHIFTILALFPAFLRAPPLRSFDFPKAVAANPPTIVAFLLFQMILTPLEAVLSIAMNAVSRHFEWQADQFACELQDKLKSSEMKDMDDRLGKALITLHVKNLSTVWVDWRYSTYHHSHPTLTERLKALPSCSREKEGLGV